MTSFSVAAQLSGPAGVRSGRTGCDVARGQLASGPQSPTLAGRVAWSAAVSRHARAGTHLTYMCTGEQTTAQVVSTLWRFLAEEFHERICVSVGAEDINIDMFEWTWG